MQDIKTLIDKASKVCGSDSALASRMGVKVQVISMLRHGRPITPETAAELADIAGESVKASVYQAMIERAAGTRREGVLREILGKSLLAGVAAMSLFSYAPEVKSETTYRPNVNKIVNLIYIVEYAIRWLKRPFRRLAWTAAPRHQRPRRISRPSAMQPPAKRGFSTSTVWTL
jgi:hypothetical protein